MNSELLTATELAKRFGVSVGTVRLWVRDRRVPVVRPTRGTIRFDLDAVQEAVACAVQKDGQD